MRFPVGRWVRPQSRRPGTRVRGFGGGPVRAPHLVPAESPGRPSDEVRLAIEDYKAALETAPLEPVKRGLIEFVLGIAYQKAQRWQESVDALNAAVRDNPQLGYLPYSIMGFSYQHLGRARDALEAFQKSEKIKPDDPAVEAGVGATLAALSRSREAIPHLEKAVRLQPDVSGGHFLLGTAYSQATRLDDAIREFRKAIDLQPDNAWAYMYLGEAFGKSRRNDDEITAEQQAIRLNPKSAEAHYLLGTAYGATNRFGEAASAYAKATELKPDYFDAYAQLAHVDIQLGADDRQLEDAANP